MAAGNAMETVLIIGGLGVGGYLLYEYNRYSSAMNTLAQVNGVTASTFENILSFFTWLGFTWGGSSGGTTEQQNLYSAMQTVLSGATIPGSTQAPGTTAPNQTTTVSTTPPTTTTTTASSSPSVSPLTAARAYAPAGSGLAPLSGSRILSSGRGTITRTSGTITRTKT